MARIRTVKPEFWTDETMAELPRDVRLLFLGLLNHVDDAGRCVDNPRLIKAAVFPLDDDVTAELIRRWLDELSTKARVVLYEASQRRYLQVSNFRKHQKIDRPQESKLPDPADCNIVSVSPDQGAFDEPSTNDPRTIDDDSLPDQVSGIGICIGTRDQGPAREARESEFETFWSTYPRRVGKGNAERAFVKAAKRAGAETIIDAAARWVDYWDRSNTDMQFIPHPATWLNRHGWEDEIPPIPAPATKSGQNASSASRVAAAIASGSGFLALGVAQ